MSFMRMHPEDSARIGAKLRELRQSLRLSQRAAARLLGCDQAKLSLIEQGKSAVTVAQFLAFANLTGRAVGALVTELLHDVTVTRYGSPLGATDSDIASADGGEAA